jgi:hypothetical protein
MSLYIRAQSLVAREAGAGIKPRVKQSATRGSGWDHHKPSKRATETDAKAKELSAARFAGLLNVRQLTLGCASLHPEFYAVACFAGSLVGL